MLSCAFVRLFSNFPNLVCYVFLPWTLLQTYPFLSEVSILPRSPTSLLECLSHWPGLVTFKLQDVEATWQVLEPSSLCWQGHHQFFIKSKTKPRIVCAISSVSPWGKPQCAKGSWSHAGMKTNHTGKFTDALSSIWLGPLCVLLRWKQKVIYCPCWNLSKPRQNPLWLLFLQ